MDSWSNDVTESVGVMEERHQLGNHRMKGQEVTPLMGLSHRSFLKIFFSRAPVVRIAHRSLITKLLIFQNRPVRDPCALAQVDFKKFFHLCAIYIYIARTGRKNILFEAGKSLSPDDLGTGIILHRWAHGLVG